MKRVPTFALAAVAFGWLGAAPSRARDGSAIDYDAAFTDSFPESAGAHRIVDWTLYTALVSGDVVAYATRVDPAVAKRLDEVKGKGYQTQQQEAGIKRDARLVAAFDGQRRRMKSMFVYADGGGVGVENNGCQHPLVYVRNEFRLVLGESSQSGDPLSHATIAPRCPRDLEAGFQITAGRSSRFKCWTTRYLTTCGWRLPDMPADLKGMVESAYPGSMKLRWRWRGLGGTVHTRYVDANSNRVGDRASIAVTVPLELALDFVDAGGHVVWTADATGVGARARGTTN